MKLITDGRALTHIISGAMERYRSYRWCVAWASTFPLFDKLLAHKDRIHSLVIGTHFNQTHPDFIAAMMGHPRVRFVMQTAGIFHPKVYLFYNSPQDWACVVGSSNFTNPGFSTNTEAGVYFDDTEDNAAQLFRKLIGMSDEQWEKGEVITASELTRYRILWSRYKPQLAKIAGQFGSSRANPPVRMKLFDLTLHRFIKAIQSDVHHDHQKRLQVLAECKRLFSAHRHFAEINLEDRCRIAGIEATDGPIPFRYFGSMRGAGRYKRAIIRSNPNVSAALDEIPLTGPVFGEHFFAYWHAFTKAFPAGGAAIATASRLLAMKRPDVFVCIDNANRSLLGKDFGLTENSLRNNPVVYWQDVIERIQETAFWTAARPKDRLGGSIWDGRAALVDVLYYRGKADRDRETASTAGEAPIQHWLAPVASDDGETAEDCIRTLITRDHCYAFGKRSSGWRHMRKGDRIAFYATDHGVAADATIVTRPLRTIRPDGTTNKDFPWVCMLADVRTYLEHPVNLDANLRLRLNAFKNRKPGNRWAWFVRGNRKVSPHDFRLLTRPAAR